MKEKDIIEPGTKICKKCGERKPIGHFGKNRTQKDGHHYYCKSCVASYYNYNKDDNKPVKERFEMQRFESVALMNKYLKRYEKSLELSIRRQQELEEKKILRHGVLCYQDRLKELRYPIAIREWEAKIANVKEQLAAYNYQQQEPETPQQEPTTPKEEKMITKKEFIDRFKDIPDDALILCLPLKDDPIPDIVGAWKNEQGSIIIHQVDDWAYVEPLTNNMILRHFME